MNNKDRNELENCIFLWQREICAPDDLAVPIVLAIVKDGNTEAYNTLPPQLKAAVTKLVGSFLRIGSIKSAVDHGDWVDHSKEINAFIQMMRDKDVVFTTGEGF